MNRKLYFLLTIVGVLIGLLCTNIFAWIALPFSGFLIEIRDVFKNIPKKFVGIFVSLGIFLGGLPILIPEIIKGESLGLILVGPLLFLIGFFGRMVSERA